MLHHVTNTEYQPDSQEACRQNALMRCTDRLLTAMPEIGLRNPRIGRADLGWDYCAPYGWVMSFYSGQLWLAFQLTGDPRLLNAARARRSDFRDLLKVRDRQDHDLGFQYSLSCVADWKMTSDPEARALAIMAAERLVERYRPDGRYIQAWNPRPQDAVMSPSFANGRIIADTMQNLALLHWAGAETGRAEFAAVANGHACTARDFLVRPDGTSFHTFLFDPATAEPLRGETFQGYRHDSCWSRGQAWMIHGFAQSALTTGIASFAQTATKLADRAEHLMQGHVVPPWDYDAPKAGAPRDSSAAAIMAAGLFILADISPAPEATRWRGFANRLLDGLLSDCDLTTDPRALGLLGQGASFVAQGDSNVMLPYGDYYFMEALMRSIGHRQFFW